MGRRAKPKGKSIWIARDSMGVFAYNHKPVRDAVSECESCGCATNDFKGSDVEDDCWELCEGVLRVLRIPKLKHGEVIEYQLTKPRS